MQSIIYDVAVSADGFIAGPDADISAFPHTGQIVEDYRARLAAYSTVIMDRATYEFGLAYGLAPGANPYPHMHAIVVSSTLTLPGDDVEIWRDLSMLEALRCTAPGPIYLCGGGQLASGVAAAGHLTHLSLKRALMILGSGVKLFADPMAPRPLKLISQTDYGGGLLHQVSRFS